MLFNVREIPIFRESRACTRLLFIFSSQERIASLNLPGIVLLYPYCPPLQKLLPRLTDTQYLAYTIKEGRTNLDRPGGE